MTRSTAGASCWSCSLLIHFTSRGFFNLPVNSCGVSAAVPPQLRYDPRMLKLAVLALLLLPLWQTAAPGRRVAITIDDGPVVGEMRDLGNFERISAGLIGSLQAEQVPATIFINERQLNVHGQRDGRAAVLERWLDAGLDRKSVV